MSKNQLDLLSSETINGSQNKLKCLKITVCYFFIALIEILQKRLIIVNDIHIIYKKCVKIPSTDRLLPRLTTPLLTRSDGEPSSLVTSSDRSLLLEYKDQLLLCEKNPAAD